MRNVFRTSLSGPVWPLGALLGHPIRQGSSRIPVWIRPGTVWEANVAQGCLPDLITRRPQLHPDLRLGISSVGGSAMHMKRTYDIGREAGIGKTQHRKEPKVFRACPCCPALRRVSATRVEAGRPPLKLLLLLNVISYIYIYIYYC